VFHSYYGRFKTRLFVLIERVLAWLCTDQIIVVSEQQRREICGSFRIGRPEQFSVIPLGIDFAEVSENRVDARRACGVSDSEVAVGIVGRLCEVKNHEMLLDSTAHLVRSLDGSDTPVRLLVIGDGHLRVGLEATARALGLTQNTVFTGFREDATSLYAGLDIAAITSLNEGTPLTLIEAMCCGRAVAATEVGGVVDVMGSRRETIDGFSVWDHGITAPSRDIQAFARGLQFLIEHPDLRREMGERGRAFVRTRLSRNRLFSDIESLYQDLLAVKKQALAPAGQVVSYNGKGNGI